MLVRWCYRGGGLQGGKWGECVMGIWGRKKSGRMMGEEVDEKWWEGQ